MRPPNASPFLVTAFIVFAIALAVIFVAAVASAGRRLGEPPQVTKRWTLGAAIGAAVWMIATWQAAASGWLSDLSRRPPRMLLLFVGVAALSSAIAFSPVGRRLARGIPLAVLVGFQGFRFPLELLMHRAYTEGVMPVQMSYSGRNFDILTGISALCVAAWIPRSTRLDAVVAVWNTVGALLLANILIIALASTPMVVAFGPDRLNTWVTSAPFVWLPTVMVVCAMSGHLIIWRALRLR